MTRKKLSKEQIKLVREHLCEDINSQACKELMQAMDECDDCRIYFDTVKKTVVLCRENDCPEEIPDETNIRLFKSLGLEDYLPDKKQKGI